MGTGDLAQFGDPLAELEEELPVGLEVHHVHWMSDVVADSVNGFFVNLAQAVAIVLIVLAVSMGWRMGSLIGIDLVLTGISMVVLSLALRRVRGSGYVDTINL